MKKVGCLVFVAVYLCVFVVTCGCLDNKGAVVTMTFDEFVNDFNESVNNQTKTIRYLFESLDDGDILIIKDTINDTLYNESLNYSRVEFVSSPGTSFPIEGNITDIFSIGDAVEIELHIRETAFTKLNPYSGELWTFQLETFREGWDDKTNDYIPVPQKYVRKVTSGT